MKFAGEIAKKKKETKVKFHNLKSSGLLLSEVEISLTSAPFL